MLIAAALVAAACGSGDDASGTVPTVPPSTTADVEPGTDEPADSPPPDVTNTPDVEVTVDAPEGPLEIEVAVWTPQEFRDQVGMRLWFDGVDVAPARCERLDITSNGNNYACTGLAAGEYSVDVELREPQLDLLIGGRCFLAETTGLTFVLTDTDLPFCSLFAMPDGLVIESTHFTAGPPTVLDSNGVDIGDHCRHTGEPFPRWECWPLPLGTYTLPDQPVGGVGDDTPWVCSPGDGFSNGPGLDGSATLERSVDEGPVPRNYWTCYADVPMDQEAGLVELRLAGPERFVERAVVQILDGDRDLFADHCRTTDEFVPGWGMSMLCEGLPRTALTVAVAAIDGYPADVSCGDPSRRSPVADLTQLPSELCWLAVYPPTLTVVIFADDPAVDELMILGPDGQSITDDCVRTDEEPTVWFECSPLPYGRYQVPTQVAQAGSGPEPFVCLPGTTTGNGPGLDDTATLSPDLDEYGSRQDIWTCTNEEPVPDIVPQIQVIVRGADELIDDARPTLLQDGVDIAGDACQTTVPAEYLIPDGPYRAFDCFGPWSGLIAPGVSGLPPGATAAVSCFERQPITGAMGPELVYEGIDWVCGIDVGG